MAEIMGQGMGLGGLGLGDETSEIYDTNGDETVNRSRKGIGNNATGQTGVRTWMGGGRVEHDGEGRTTTARNIGHLLGYGIIWYSQDRKAFVHSAVKRRAQEIIPSINSHRPSMRAAASASPAPTAVPTYQHMRH